MDDNLQSKAAAAEYKCASSKEAIVFEVCKENGSSIPDDSQEECRTHAINEPTTEFTTRSQWKEIQKSQTKTEIHVHW